MISPVSCCISRSIIVFKRAGEDQNDSDSVPSYINGGTPIDTVDSTGEGIAEEVNDVIVLQSCESLSAVPYPLNGDVVVSLRLTTTVIVRGGVDGTCT